MPDVPFTSPALLTLALIAAVVGVWGVGTWGAVRRWAAAGDVVLSRDETATADLLDPRPLTLRLGKNSEGRRDGGFVCVMVGLILLPGVMRDVNGWGDALAPWLGVWGRPLAFAVPWVALGYAFQLADRRPEGMPPVGVPAVTDGGVWDGRFFHPWEQVYAVTEAPAPNGRTAVAVAVPGTTVKALMGSKAATVFRRLREGAASEEPAP